MTRASLVSDIGRQKRHIALSVLGLLLLVLSVGLFALFQVSRMKSELRDLGEQVLVLSSSLARLETEKGELVDAARELLDGLSAGSGAKGIPSNQVEHFVVVASELLQKQDSSIEALEGQAQEFSQGVDPTFHVRPLSRVVSRSRSDLDRFRRLLDLIKSTPEPGSREVADALREVVDSARRGLARLSNDIGDILSVLSTRTLQRAERLEHFVLIEISIATFVALILGVFVSLRIKVLQGAVVEGQQLVALGKVAVALQHEINNPLAVIIGNSYIVRSTETSPQERDEALHAIEHAATRIANVIQKTKDLEALSTTDYLGGVEMIDLSHTDPSPSSHRHWGKL